MRKAITRLAIPTVALGGLLLLGGCFTNSKIFDNNCTNNGMIENPQFCTGTLHPNAGPWSGGAGWRSRSKAFC